MNKKGDELYPIVSYDPQQEIEKAQTEQQIRKLKRRGNLEAVQEYIIFASKTSVGIGALLVGGLEFLVPSLLPVATANPVIIMGIGISLLAGKPTLDLLRKTLETMEE